MEAVSTLVRLLETIIVDTVCYYVHRWIDKHS